MSTTPAAVPAKAKLKLGLRAWMEAVLVECERAAAGFRVDMPVGRVARYPRGDGKPVTPRESRIA